MELHSQHTVPARSRRRPTLTAWLLAACLVVHACGAAAVETLRAEYAVRWTPSAGGPADPEHVLKILGLKKGKGSQYEVQYFDTDPAVNPMPGFTAVVRERVGKKTDVTWKYRGGFAPPEADRATWACPLLNAAKRKDEQDISIGSDGSVIRRYSRSCTAEQRIDKALPMGLKVAKRGCKADVTVLESKDDSMSVEIWTLKPNAIYLEVSSKGDGAAATLDAFKNKVVAKLTAGGVRPLDRGMTEIASQC